jgi:hypothetical protein
MDTKETLIRLCHDEKSALRPKNECRALMINHLILEDGLGVDAAEDLADKTLNQSGFWPIPKFEFEEEEGGGDAAAK